MSQPPHLRADDPADRPAICLSILNSPEFLDEVAPPLGLIQHALAAKFVAIEAAENSFRVIQGEWCELKDWKNAGRLGAVVVEISSHGWRLSRNSQLGKLSLTLGGFGATRMPNQREWRLMQWATETIERQYLRLMQAQRAQRELQRLHKAIAAVDAGVWQLNLTREHFHCDQNVARILGANAADIDCTMGDFLARIHNEDQASVREALERSVLSSKAERVVFRAKSSERWLSAGFVYELDGQGGGDIVGLMRDYHRQKAAEVELELHQQQLESLVKQLRRNNRIDPLTGIANRIALDERLSTEIMRARSQNKWLTIFMIDVDHFKSFNDQFGHINGDAALKQTAICIVDALPKGDLAVRFGGEEFCAMAATEPALSIELAERLRCAVQDAAWSMRPITVSIGVCCMRGVDIDQGLLFQRADAALYRAKAAGRNRVVMAEI